MCGRRWGKSAAGIRWLCDGAIAGEFCGWFAPNYKYAGDAWRELVARLAPITESKNEQDRRLELKTGGVIEVWTMDSPDPARGRKYHRVVIDEAGIVRELLDLWQAAIRPTLVDFGGKALMLGTPKGRRHGFVTMFARGESGDPEWQSFRASTLENPYIPPSEVEAARKELPPEVFRQEFEGVPTDDGANPFGLDAIRAAIGPLSEHPPVVYGADLARSLDFSVVLGLDAWGKVCRLERFQTPWAETKTRIATMTKGVPVVADATGVGDGIVADLQAEGVEVAPFIFTQPSKLRLMQRLVAAFQGKTITIPDGWLVRELEAFEFVYTASGVKYEAPSGLHDDGVMALGLALHGWDRVQGVAPEDIPLPQWRGDDPNAEMGRVVTVGGGDFTTQLPEGGW
jgi:phage FluMu gp28-like protein